MLSAAVRLGQFRQLSLVRLISGCHLLPLRGQPFAQPRLNGRLLPSKVRQHLPWCPAYQLVGCNRQNMLFGRYQRGTAGRCILDIDQ